MVLNVVFNFLNRVFKSVELNPSKLFLSKQVKTHMVMKKVGIYGATGVIVAVLIIAGIMASGIKIPWRARFFVVKCPFLVTDDFL